jgi:hypothetical protein
MFPETLTITVTSAAEEILVEQALAMVRDFEELAGTAPAGQILNRCEEAAVAKGREFSRQALEQTVAKRLEAAQKRGAAATLRLRPIPREQRARPTDRC